MAFCKNCGAYVPDNASFCSSCGTVVSEKPKNSQFYSQAHDVNDNFYDNGVSEEQDIKDNKLMAVIAYLGILVLIPIFTAKDSKYACFHATQGLTLFVVSTAYSILSTAVSAVINLIFPPEHSFLFLMMPNPIASVISIILSLVSFLFVVLSIIGIVNAVSGNKTELPIIGKIDILNKILK